MLKRLIFCNILLMTCFIASCQSPPDKINQKNRCYEKRLNELKKSNLYKKVISGFKDTFRILKDQKEYFGDPSIVDHKVDDAIFFKKDSSECLLIVLQRNRDTLYQFGSARIIKGVNRKGHWRFEISIVFHFERDFFKENPKNSFQNISMLARYGVLVRANVNKAGCQINEKYWFSNLK